MFKKNLYSPEIIPLLPRTDKTIIILLEEYRELLIIKGKYEESQRKIGLKSEKVSSKNILYKCNPSLNKKCQKSNCIFNGTGDCDALQIEIMHNDYRKGDSNVSKNNR